MTDSYETGSLTLTGTWNLIGRQSIGGVSTCFLIESAFVTQHGWFEQEEDSCVVYFLKVRVDHQRLTPNVLWELWEKEADVALKAKAEGRIVALYKGVEQRRVLIVIDVESHDEIDQALMAVMPLEHDEELEEILPVREYESFAKEVRQRWQ